MKKYFVLFPLFFLFLNTVYARAVYAQEQGLAQAAGQQASGERGVTAQLDAAVRRLAVDLSRKLTVEKAATIAVDQFRLHNSLTPLGSYWHNHLIEELVNISDRTFVVLAGGAAGAEWTISGEIIEMPGIIRVYTRLVRSSDRAIEGAFHSDIERNEHTVRMIASRSGSGPGGDSSWEFPIHYQIGENERVQAISRTLQDDSRDFFLLVPSVSGRLIMETTGSTDTYMEFYDADSSELLAENDDGGQGTNARIRYNVEAGRRYIALVRGFSPSTRGNYAFRAYMFTPDYEISTWENPEIYEIGSNDRVPVINRTIHEGGDEHFFLFVPAVSGLLTMETTGSTDTYFEFFDAETREMLAENDDGGQGFNARIRHIVEAGRRYILKIQGYSDSDTGPYGFRAFIQERLPPDEYEPNDDPSQAKWIEIGMPQTHTFHTWDDVDWVRFRVETPGLYTIQTRGVDSNRLDTYIELYDENLNLIASDDDGGEALDSRLSRRLNIGIYYLKVECLDEDPDQAYTISIVLE